MRDASNHRWVMEAGDWRPSRQRTRSCRAALSARYFLAILAMMVVLPSVGMAERLAVTSPVANIRSGPGTNYDVLWQIEQYHPIIVIQKIGAWYQFRDYQGDTGYIHNSLLGPVESVITASNKCNVRSGPGTQFPVVFTVGDGVPFKVLERKHNWLRVEHADSDRGWIYRSLVW